MVFTICQLTTLQNEESLVQELEQAETTLGVKVGAAEQTSRHLVVVLTTAQARLRPILQM